MEQFYGRLLLENDLKATDQPVSDSNDKFLITPQKVLKHAKVTKIQGMFSVNKRQIQCNRCGSLHFKHEVQLPLGCFYCPTCINLGRVRSDEWLYAFAQEEFQAGHYLRWRGKLTPAQQNIADQLVSNSKKHFHTLVRAVTGAGKTEMTYPLIDQFLKSGKAIAFVSPRIDVCIEIHNRLSHDFSCAIPLLYGHGKSYFRSPLVVATTHQLLRFQAAFDLIIVDEVDAFPFSESPYLYFALKKALKKEAQLLYLTATSTNYLEQQIKNGTLKQLELNQRFHQSPLILPRFFWHTQLIKKIKKQRKTGFPLLIFAAEIQAGQLLTQKLQKNFPHEKIACVSSKSSLRQEYIQQFRQGELDILVSTTILERGVTFPKVDVFVNHAEHSNFTKSSLIQMAGRVGRSSERPNGLVYFFHEGRTRAMTKARQEIKRSNLKGSLS